MTSAPAPDLGHLPSSSNLAGLGDDELMARQQQFAAARRLVDVGAALVSADLARRSRRDLGYAGLAQREGLRSPQQLIERLAGVTPEESHAMVQVGQLLDDPGASPWLSAVASAVSAGDISVLAADAIRSGLGSPSEMVPAEDLSGAAQQLVLAAPEIAVRRIAGQARALRDQLDQRGVAEREEALRAQRSTTASWRSDGMLRVVSLYPPEEGAFVLDALDLVVAPRRGGPRFVDPEAKARAQALIDDPRTNEQLMADGLFELIRIAAEADDGRVFVQRRPAVSIHVDRTQLESGEGVAHIEGQSASISIASARRLACAAGAVPILFEGGKAIDVGRTQRLFTERQRIALAARDGGCRFEGCDRPPSWCEAHHTDEWKRDDGRTDLATGILLCRFHHMMVHNQGWRIEPRADTFVAISPPESGRAEIILPSRNPLHGGARARRESSRELVDA